MTRRRDELVKYARLIAYGVGIALAVVGIALLAIGFPMLPRSSRRTAVEGALRIMLGGYALAIAGSAAGVLVLWALVWRARRRRERAGWLAKGLLLSATVLLSLATAEIGASVWTAWLHRMPALPTRFDPPEGIEHLVVIGGSGALGHPYSPNASIGQVVAWGLELALPGAGSAPRFWRSWGPR